MMEHFQNISDYRRFYELLTKVSFGRLPAVRKKEVDPEKKSVVTAFRDRVKKIIKGWKESYGRQSLETVIQTMSETRETTCLLYTSRCV